MPAFAANLSFLFQEYDFLDRFAQAAACGFPAVEYLFPYEHAPDAIARALDDSGLLQALFNLPPGDWSAGERGLAALADRFDEVCAGLDQAMPYIEATKVPRVHMMAGIADPADDAALAAYRRSVEHVAGRLQAIGVELMLEPINGRDMPGYFLNDMDRAAELIAAWGLPNVKLQFDIYHCQIIHGDVTTRLKRMMPIIGHVQIASVPSRNEPDGEELNYPYLFQQLDLQGYGGFVGCEYRPRGKTSAGLDWFTDAGGRTAP